MVKAEASGSLFQSFSPCVCLPGHLYVLPAEIRVTRCSRFIWTWDCLQSWLAPEGRSCDPKQRVVGWSVQPFPPSLLDKFPTSQWLKFSALGIPVFLWQWVPMSHENKTFFSLKWNLSLFCSSVWALLYHCLIFVPMFKKFYFNSPLLCDKRHYSPSFLCDCCEIQVFSAFWNWCLDPEIRTTS